MIRGKNIICFGSENWEYPGFQQTIMRKLSKSNRIIFVNPLGSRKATLKWANLNIYFRKIKSLFAKKFSPTPNCLVVSAFIVPLIYNSMVNQFNRFLIKRQFKKLLSKHNFNSYILWIGTPTAAFILDLFNPELTVYHAVDRYSEFSFVNQRKIMIYEEQVARKSDLILCTADAIRNDLRKYNKSVYTVTHAVDFEHFYNAINSKTIPEDLQSISKPIIGYFGGLSERVNYSLLIKVAHRYPNANIVLIGKKLCNLQKLEKISNIHILGPKGYKVLPIYLRRFDVCLIPYLVNDLMLGVDPIKLREYLCQGKPVVSTKLPEVEKLKPHIFIGDNEDDFVDKVGNALAETKSSFKKDRIHLAKNENWSNKLTEISEIIFESFSKKISTT